MEKGAKVGCCGGISSLLTNSFWEQPSEVIEHAEMQKDWKRVQNASSAVNVLEQVALRRASLDQRTIERKGL